MFFASLTLTEIPEENGEDPGDIILFPPENREATDADSGGENENNLIHLPTRALLRTWNCNQEVRS